ncbi:F-box protein At1g61340-like [Gastrolobium bilobum]|uniref:F-box protein At1g61340-like n=1 Tax=Gastrolobium bilobum TaxID=150636 RepID=UPI002AB1A0FA|nr:F-box protein At1g61340-like [Gastrolobium bilobum]
MSIGDMEIGFEGYCYTRALGRKRVLVSNNVEDSPLNPNPLKRTCSGRMTLNSEISRLETLPHDILIRLLCGVDHEDLKQLFHVSRTIREATQIAKEMHFEYSTPKKKTFACLQPIDLEDASGLQEIEAPNAPLRKSKSRLSGRNLASISVALFASTEENSERRKK